MRGNLQRVRPPTRRRSTHALLVGLTTVLVACAPQAPTAGQAPTSPTPAAPATTTPASEPSPHEVSPTPTPTGLPDATRTVHVEGPERSAKTFHAEIAADPDTRRVGLMHRPSLPADAGMLFVYPDDTDGGFWMKNTLIPLTIAFATADGEIVAVLDMEPCEADPCPTYRPGASYRMALEVNAGALGAAEPGWRMEVDGGLPPAS